RCTKDGRRRQTESESHPSLDSASKSMRGRRGGAPRVGILQKGYQGCIPGCTSDIIERHWYGPNAACLSLAPCISPSSIVRCVEHGLPSAATVDRGYLVKGLNVRFAELLQVWRDQQVKIVVHQIQVMLCIRHGIKALPVSTDILAKVVGTLRHRPL